MAAIVVLKVRRKMFASNMLNRIQNRYRCSLSNALGRRMVELRPEFPIISFTFDDFPQSALRVGGAILERYEVRGTYYVSLSLMDHEIPAGRAFSKEDLRQAVADGHELGCHTFSHCHAWETDPAAFEESIIQNKQALKALIPDVEFKSLSYPIAWPRPQTKRLASKHFECCRSSGATFNLGWTDANNLQANFIEKHRDHPETLMRLIEENNRTRGWLIFATHDIGDHPTPFGCTGALFEALVEAVSNSGARVLPVGAAWDAARPAR